ncbi:hypothetical protein FKM82_000650 [Ascaphus truei]
MEETPVKVAVRIRPLLSKEILHNHQVCVRLVPNTQQVIIGKDRVFTFDCVFGKISSQDDVYSSCIKPLLLSLIEGYNATVFAYGQTGSGKTYTIGGGHFASVAEDEKGIIPRAIQELFQSISEHHNIDFSVKVSYIEVYKEELRDLLELETNMKDLHIREDEKGNTVIVGAKECQVESADEVLSLLQAGSAARHTYTTQMNEHSSRSHAIFTINICQQRPKNIDIAKDGSPKPVQVITSKFHFVDLAGSERVTKTGNTGERFKESIQINSGLLALGNVISALGDPKRKSAHVPYRDAKITRILKDSLGGNAKTVMITCISPSSSDFDESLNSLKYANRARNIKNKAIVNYNPDWDRMDEMELEIKALREALQNQQSSRVGRTSQISEEWGQEKNKIRSLEEQLAQLQLECFNHRHCIEEALSVFVELKDIASITQSQKHRLQDWLSMAEGLRSEMAAISGIDGTVGTSRDELHHITILQLKRELKKCQDALTTDENVFGRKALELKELQEQIQCMLQENREDQKSIQEAEHIRKLQTEKLVDQQVLIDELQDKLEKMSQSQSSQRAGKEEELQEIISKRPYSVPLSNDSQILSSTIMQSTTRPESRKVRTSPPSYSLERVVAGFRTRSQMLLDLIEEQDEVLHDTFSDQSEEEGDEKHEEKREKSPFSRSINRTWTRQQAPMSGDINTSASQIAKPLSHNEGFSHTEASAGTAMESLRESQVLNMKKLKSSEIRLVQAKQKMRELTLNIKMKEELIKELEKTGNDAHSVNRQYSLKISQLEQESEQAKTELSEAQKQLQELENKELRDIAQKPKLQKDSRKKMDAANLKVQVIQKKQQDTKKLASFSVQNEKRVAELERNVDHMRQQQAQQQRKLREEAEKKKKLEAEIQKDQQQIKEEHILFQLEEGIEALEAAIDYKNEYIQSRQQSVKDSSQILSQSEANVIEKLSSLSPSETRSILVRYFNKVVTLRETERKLQLQSEELAMKVSEQENIVRELESTLEHLALQSDRRLTQQQTEHEQKMQLLLQHFRDNDGESIAENIKDYEAKVELLEKELFFYKKTSRELKKKLREVVGDSKMAFSKNNGSGDGFRSQDETGPRASEEQKWVSKLESNKKNRKPKEPENSVQVSRLQHNTFRVGGYVSEMAQSSESHRENRRHFSAGDDPEDIEEPQSAHPHTPLLSHASKVEPNRAQLQRVTPVKMSRRELRQISVSELSTRRSSISSILADSIEVARKSTDLKI